MVRQFIERLLPKKADNRFPGLRLSYYVFILLTSVGMVRSLIHLFAPDGGAGSIAGIDLTGSGAEAVVFAFGLWGSAQLLLSLIQLLVALRYRSLVPLMYLLIVVEILLRMIVGWTKPVDFQHLPPGALGNWIILPLAGIMFVLCFIKPLKPER